MDRVWDRSGPRVGRELSRWPGGAERAWAVEPSIGLEHHMDLQVVGRPLSGQHLALATEDQGDGALWPIAADAHLHCAKALLAARHPGNHGLRLIPDVHVGLAVGVVEVERHLVDIETLLWQILASVLHGDANPQRTVRRDPTFHDLRRRTALRVSLHIGEICGVTRGRIFRRTSRSQLRMNRAMTSGGVDLVLPLLRLT